MSLQEKIDRSYPRFYDYEVEISKDQWIELLLDREIFAESNIDHMKCIYSFDNHAATCKEVSGKLGGSANTYIGLANALAKRVAVSLNIESLPAREDDSDVYWYILFYGQKVNRKERGEFEWKLRPELAAALKEIYPQLDYPKPIIEKKLDSVPTSVWLATALLTYMSLKNDHNLKDMTIFHETIEIQKLAKQLCFKNIDYARPYQWCNGDHSNSYRYLRAGEKALRRLTAPGEFGGEKERPEKIDPDMEVEIGDENVTIKKVISFIEGEYAELIQELVPKESLELEKVIDYLLSNPKLAYKKPEKADDSLVSVPDSFSNGQLQEKITQVEFMKLWFAVGSEARNKFVELAKCISGVFPNYEMGNCSNWISQEQKIPEYFWIEFKKKGFQDCKSSISLFAWRYEDKVSILVAVEIRDKGSRKEDFDKHNKLIFKQKLIPEMYYRVIKKDDTNATDFLQPDIIKMHQNNEVKKIRAEIAIDGPYVSNRAGNIISQIRDAFKKLEPYYNVAIGDKNMIGNEGSGSSVSHFNLNTILYGPPGTGKTYNTVLYAVAICEGTNIELLQREPYGQVLERFEDLKKAGRIAFTTFHQSYGYEEFIEGIKPVISQQDDDAPADIKYQYASGVFKKFCEEARKVEVQSLTLKIGETPIVWNVLLEGTGETELKNECFEKGYIKIGWANADKVITNQSENLNDIERRILLNFQDEMQVGDVVFIQKNNTSIDAIGIITGPYEFIDSPKHYPRTRKVQWVATGIDENVYALNKNTRLDRKTVYPLRKMDIKEVITLIEKYKGSNEISVAENVKPYVFIIDEINRGNISKIFGELITLIEPTKRIGASEPTTATLPYTGDPFGVPNNVYILGTMNTADRSIAVMDTALRRRFNFVEMMPDASILAKMGITDIKGIDVVTMLNTINERIEYLFDREHTIGHAYFTSLAEKPSLENLERIFLNSIIPLLQEFFYEDYSKIQLVLGDNAKTENAFKFILDEKIKKDVFKGSPDIDLPEKKYTIQKEAFKKADSYKQIY